MNTEIQKIQQILNRHQKKKTFSALGQTYPARREFLESGWYWNSSLRCWQIEGYESDPAVKKFLGLDYKETGIWVKAE